MTNSPTATNGSYTEQCTQLVPVTGGTRRHELMHLCTHEEVAVNSTSRQQSASVIARNDPPAGGQPAEDQS